MTQIWTLETKSSFSVVVRVRKRCASSNVASFKQLLVQPRCLLLYRNPEPDPWASISGRKNCLQQEETGSRTGLLWAEEKPISENILKYLSVFSVSSHCQNHMHINLRLTKCSLQSPGFEEKYLNSQHKYSFHQICSPRMGSSGMHLLFLHGFQACHQRYLSLIYPPLKGFGLWGPWKCAWPQIAV